jgi:chloramphenicol-sensitive protein RarD
MSDVHAIELTAHRIVWSFIPLAALLTVRGLWGNVWVALRRPRTLLLLTGSTILICLNWLGFIWAVFIGRLSEASLGYYLNPLISVLLGFLFFRERLRPLQKVALGIASLGVLYLTVRLGYLPWIALGLAFSFALYGLFRKKAAISAAGGLTVETALLCPPALIALGYLEVHQGLSILHGDLFMKVFLPMAGIMTAVPLVLFAASARRLPLSAIGFMQYTTPSMQLLVAVLLFGEPFNIHKAIAFGAIWTALALYTTDTLRGVGERRRASLSGEIPRIKS